MSGNIFSRLFIFEMANNHSGDIEHGLRIVREMKQASKDFDFNFGFKFQYRNLDTFIHSDYKNRQDIKYVKRFSDTRISDEDFLEMLAEVKKQGFIAICTPFDEESVERIVEHRYDIIKIASCSLTDWPLLEKIAKTDLPIIASTAAASLEEIDKVVSFFEHRNKAFCLMHCVGAYPTQKDALQLNQLDLLMKRYPELIVGFSTHEEPDNVDAVKIAIAKGAYAFERHVGVYTEEYGINGYSSTPDQVKNLLTSAQDVFEMCGISGSRHEISEKERDDLRGLKRGVFALKTIKKGEKIDSCNIFYAIPNKENQVLANDISKYIEYVASKDINNNEPVMFDFVVSDNLREKVLEIVKQLKEIIMKSNIVLSNRIELELSHHYGIEKYFEFGAAILNCINREYCKKLIILLPGQDHPIHHHMRKEETFQVLYGEMAVHLNGNDMALKPGEMLIVEREAKHSFSSKEGCIFEEISTTHFKNDSFYEDERVGENEKRKTQVTFWSDWLEKEIV